MNNEQEQLVVDQKHINDVLFKKLSQSQNDNINLEALATQLLEENKSLKQQLEEALGHK